MKQDGRSLLSKFVLLSCSLLSLCLLQACFSSAPKKPDGIYDRRNQAAEFMQSGNKLYANGQYTEAMQFFRLALEYNTSVDNLPGLARVYNSIGKIHAAQSEFDKAIEQFTQALSISRQIADAELILQSANNIGEVYLLKSDFAKAYEHLTAILAEKLQGNGETFEKAVAVLLYNVGLAAKGLGKFTETLSYAALSLEISTRHKEFSEVASNHYLVASVHSKQENYEAAVQSLLLALENDKRAENSLGIAKDLTAIGLVMVKQKKIKESLEYFLRSFQIYRTIAYVPGIISTLGHLETQAKALGLTEEAKQYREALDLVLKSRQESAR